MSKCTDPNDLIYAFYEIAKRIDKTSDLEIQVNDNGEAQIWQCYPVKDKLIKKYLDLMSDRIEK